MRKIFTFILASLATISLMAADVFISLDDMDVDATFVTYNGSEVKAQNKFVYVELPSAEVQGTFTVYGSSDKNDRFLYIYGNKGTVKDDDRAMVMKAAGASVEYTADDVATVEEKPYLVFSSPNDFKFKKFVYTYEGGTPSTDPVTKVTVSGPEEGYIGIAYTFKGKADAIADSWIWYVNDVAIDGANAASFSFTPEAAGEYRIKAGARNQYNPEDGWINSEEVTFVAKVPLEQVEVSEATVWDFSNAATVKEIKFTDTTEPKKNDTILLANVDGMKNDAEFNSQALKFVGEFAIRDSKYSQGSMLMFKTTVPGFVQVDFSNTGNKTDPRYIAINGVVNTEVGTLNQDKVTSAVIPVEAGEVMIEGSFNPYNPQYLHFFKISFTLDDPQAIDNTEDGVKAVKFIQNGQLFIEKNGTIFNAQGTIVR